ncbi:hypothetical protein IAT38_000602 [Cryptococcus sp. DSM 104549]
MASNLDTKQQPLDIDYKPEIEHVESQLPDKHAQGGFVYVPGSIEERKLVRKIDRHLIPMLWLMYVFNYIDRTNIGNAKTGGMQADLNLSSSDYSLVLSIFFVGYLLNEVPSNMILSRSRPSIFLPSIMFTWGAMSIGAKGVTSLGGMVGFRFALGVVESGYFPGVLLLLSCWYKPAELSKRVALFYTASLVSGAFGGLMAGGIIEGMEGVAGTRGWKWLFIIEGLCTVVIALVAFFVLPDWPQTTKWLSDDERILAIARLRPAEEGEAEAANEVHLSHKQAFLAAVKDPKTWFFLVILNMITSVGTISYFFPTLMTSLGYHGRSAQFMTVPLYAVALVIATATGFSSDYFRQKGYHAAGACALGFVSFIICATVKNATARYVFIAFGGAGVWTATPIYLSWIITMFEGREKRAVSIAIINGFGNISSVYGSFWWPASDAPLYHKGFGITTGMIGAAGMLILAARWKFGDRGYAPAAAAS